MDHATATAETEPPPPASIEARVEARVAELAHASLESLAAQMRSQGFRQAVTLRAFARHLVAQEMTVEALAVDAVRYHRLRHAAHYGGGRGADVEQWMARSAWRDPRPAGVPSDAERTAGYLDDDGAQVVVWERRAPLSAGTCPRCRS